MIGYQLLSTDNPAQIKPIPTSIAPTSRYNDIRPDTSVLACNKTISNMIFIYKGESSIPHSIRCSSSLQTTDSTFLLFRRWMRALAIWKVLFRPYFRTNDKLILFWWMSGVFCAQKTSYTYIPVDWFKVTGYCSVITAVYKPVPGCFFPLLVLHYRHYT